MQESEAKGDFEWRESADVGEWAGEAAEDEGGDSKVEQAASESCENGAAEQASGQNVHWLNEGGSF